MSKAKAISSVVKKNRLVIISILLVSVFVIVLGLLAAFVPLKNGKPLFGGGSFTDEATDSNSSSQSGSKILQEKAQKLVDSGDIGKAEALIKESPRFGSDWYSYSILADIYLNSDQSDKALETLLTMEKKFGIGQYTAAVRIAELYLKNNNREQAISYYQKAIELLRDSKSPTREWEIEQLEQKIGGIK